MGDRGNIAILTGEKRQVWFYTHWRGSEIGASVKEALALNDRWTDAPYLARIVWDKLCRAESHGETTGFGISSSIGDNEHPVIVVDIPKQRVFLIEEPELTDGTVPDGYTPKKSQSFTEFISS